MFAARQRVALSLTAVPHHQYLDKDRFERTRVLSGGKIGAIREAFPDVQISLDACRC